MGPTSTSIGRPDVQAASPVLAAPIRLTPARPAAVNVPVLTVATVVVLLPALLEAALRPAGGRLGPALTAGLLAALVLVHAYAARILLSARNTRFRTGRLLVLTTVLFVVVFQAVVPGVNLHWSTLVLTGVLALVGIQATRSWRAYVLRHRPIRVTVLAPSEMAAVDALDRLEGLPGIRVMSVVVPGCVVERAARMLDRPVARAVGGRLKLEDRVVVSCPSPDTRVGSTIAQLVALGHTITSETATMRRAEGRVDSTRVNALNLLMSVPRLRGAEFVRRLVDIVVSAAVLVLFSPLFLAISLAILIDSGWPVFYRQGRVGRRGRLFQVLKFRTMRTDAENLSGPVFATERDPRLTRIGGFMRKYRLDELPQFFNVLIGQMSVVGPRPERPHFFNVLRQDVPLFELRTYVRPGITGWAQIRLPYAADSSEARAKLEYDLYYVTHRTLAFDLAIVLETMGVALSGAGAR